MNPLFINKTLSDLLKNLDQFNKKKFQLNLIKVAKQINKTLNSKNIVFSCGNGGSASQASHFTTELIVRFKKEYEHIYETWEKGDFEREWVPWDWCDTIKRHTKNNSIIMFTPSHRTLHAVKMDYPHTKFQRTQIYGNLMYPGRNVKKYRKNKYHDLKDK